MLFGQTFRALRHRDFRLFISGQVVSLIGTWMQNVAQSWLVYRLTHSELLLGAVWFAMQVPVLALASLGGVVSDRYSRRRIVIWTQFLAMLQALTLAALTLSGRVEVWHVLALAVALGTINAFDIPARQSLVIEMVGREHLLNAISLNSVVFNLARIAGPALAGLLVAGFGEGICFLVNGISFGAVIVGLLAMRLKDSQRPAGADSPWSHLANGFRNAYRNRPVRVVLSMVAATTVASMPAVVLMPFFADAIFGKGSEGFGYLTGAMGIGAVIGTLVLARRSSVPGLDRVMLASSLLMGAGFVLFAASPSFGFSLAVMVAIGYGVMRQTASANTLIQTIIEDEYRGRTMALFAITVQGIGPFAGLAAGALAHIYGPRPTVMAGGLFCLLCGIIFRFSLPLAAETPAERPLREGSPV